MPIIAESVLNIIFHCVLRFAVTHQQFQKAMLQVQVTQYNVILVILISFAFYLDLINSLTLLCHLGLCMGHSQCTNLMCFACPVLHSVPKTCDNIFYNNFNNKCPITIIFGIETSSQSMCHRKVVSFPTSPIYCNYLTVYCFMSL